MSHLLALQFLQTANTTRKFALRANDPVKVKHKSVCLFFKEERFSLIPIQAYSQESSCSLGFIPGGGDVGRSNENEGRAPLPLILVGRKEIYLVSCVVHKLKAQEPYSLTVFSCTHNGQLSLQSAYNYLTEITRMLRGSVIYQFLFASILKGLS